MEPEIAEEQIPTIQKVKKLFPYILAIICITSFYSFEFFNGFSDEFFASKKEYQLKIDKVTASLSKIKEYSKNTEAYQEYLQAVEAKNIAKKKYFEVKKSDRFFGFKTTRTFLVQFGPMLCLFMYALYMLFRSFYFEKKNNGMKFLHGLLLTGPMFHFYWIFQPFQDVSKMSYYFMTVFSVIMVVFTIYLITKYRNHRINKLKENQLELAKFAFKNTKPEKRDEMLSTIKKVARNV